MNIKEFCKKYKLTEAQATGQEEISGYLDLRSLTSLPEGFSPTVGGTPDAIPRIVSDELFNKAQEKRDQNKHAPERAVNADYILTSKLYCGLCHEKMTGMSGTSKMKRLHFYYKCNAAKQNKCKCKAIKRDFIENIVIGECRNILTDSNISKIAEEVFNICEKEKKSDFNLARLNKLYAENEKQRKNVMDSIKMCDMDRVRVALFEEMEALEITRADLEKQMLAEESRHASITIPQIKFFLNQLKGGDIDDIKYRNTLVKVFLNSVYLYEEKVIMIFNSGPHPVEVTQELLEELLQGSTTGRLVERRGIELRPKTPYGHDIFIALSDRY